MAKIIDCELTLAEASALKKSIALEVQIPDPNKDEILAELNGENERTETDTVAGEQNSRRSARNN